MYSNISNDAKAALKSKAVITTARIILTSDNTVIDGNNLTEVIITDQCYQDGVIIGTAMCKEVEIELINNNYDLADKEFSLEVGVLLPNNTYEYIPYGNFIIKDYQKIVSSNHYKIIAYDYMDKFNPIFIDNNPTVEDSSTYVTPMTLQEFYQYVANQYGVTIEPQIDLPNSTFSITEKPYFDGMSGRIVLSRIAEMMGCFAKINRNNRLEMRLKNTTNEQFSRDEMNNSLEIDNRFGPINVIALRLSQVEGENATRRDEDSIAEYGETVLQISDNPFVPSEALRSAAVDDIYNYVDGFSYYPTTFNGKLIYLDCGDEVEVQDMNTNTYYKTIILKQVLKIPSTRSSKFENKALTATGLQYQFTPEQKQINKRTEYLVDKQNQQILQVIEKQEGTQSQVNSITQTVESTINTIQDYESDTNSRIEELETNINGLTNKLVENGGNNIFYYDTEFWTGGEVQRTIIRNVQIGDDLSGKTLILSFPEGVNLGEDAISDIIVGNNNYSISVKQGTDTITYDLVQDIIVKENGTNTRIYRYDVDTSEIINNYTEFTLSDNFGEVTSINTNITAYQYIQIEETITEKVLNLEEYTDSEFKNNSVSGLGYIVGNGSSKQNTNTTKVAVANGVYSIAFKYKKISASTANVSVKINSVEYLLEETIWTEFKQIIEVNSNYIEIEFIADTDNALYVVDLMGNIGESPQIWTQNPNETRTDTVKIGKGIEVSSSIEDTKLKADADGVRIVQATNERNVIARFTKDGTITKELTVEGKAQIAGLLIQQVGNQTWISSLL